MRIITCEDFMYSPACLGKSIDTSEKLHKLQNNLKQIQKNQDEVIVEHGGQE